MRRRFASLLLAAMLTLTAVAEDLGEPIPEVEPAAEEIYEETEMATESEDPEEDDARTEETISTAETTAEDVETTEEVSESEEVDEKVETDSGDGTVHSETGTDDTELETVGSDDTDCGTDNGGSETEDEIQELGRDVSSEETEGVIGDSDLAGTEGDAELDGGRDTVYGDAEVTESEVEEEVIVVESEPIVIESEPIVIGETEESEVIEEPMMMAPMMVGLSLGGSSKESSYAEAYIISGGKDGQEFYKEDATNTTDKITFGIRTSDKIYQYAYSINGGSWIGWNGNIYTELFTGKKYELAWDYTRSTRNGQFYLTYSEIYNAMSSGVCTVTIHIHQNSDGIKGSETTFTFIKHDYSKDFSNDKHSVSLTSDKTECYPGDTVIFTASATALRESANVNDQYTISYTYVVNGTEYKNEGTVFMYTAGTETITCYVVAYFTPKTSS